VETVLVVRVVDRFDVVVVVLVVLETVVILVLVVVVVVEVDLEQDAKISDITKKTEIVTPMALLFIQTSYVLFWIYIQYWQNWRYVLHVC